MPPSKVKNNVRCSAECNAIYRKRIKSRRKRDCETCGNEFIPRLSQTKLGGGKFCSQKCNPSGAKALKIRGWPIGEKAYKWRGGRKATYKRRLVNGKLAAYRKANADTIRATALAYRAKHPEVGRAAQARRSARKKNAGGKHTSTDIRELMRLQKGQCAACRINIKNEYHVDHITSLAKGGSNDKHNVQLLCGPCNRSKHTKDPIRFMQERGFLL